MKTHLTPTRLALWAALPMAHTSEVERRLTMILDPTRSRRRTTRRIVLVAFSATGGPGQRGLIFAFRLPPTAEGVTTLLEAPESLGSSSSGVWPGKMQGQENSTEARLNRGTEGMRMLAAIYPSSATQGSLRAGIAAGPWKVSASRTITTGATIHADSQKFIFSPVAEMASGLSLTVTTDATDDDRVVAVDGEGQERLPVSIGGESIGTLDQITARFSQSLSQIKSFRVETRPFTWTEFKDVALRPTK